MILRVIIALLGLSVAVAASAQVTASGANDRSTMAKPAQADGQDGPQPVDLTPIKELGDEYQNSIKLLQNRFRIDYKVEKVTLVFFRRYGSAPVVLVKPDGSKVFQSQAEEQGIYWYDDVNFDLIELKEPTPGPWQAVGEILPDSRVMIISDIELHADPLPNIIFSGEILKQTARITNGGEPITRAEFRDVVNLNIKFSPTNNPDAANFGAEAQNIASFKDDGLGMDEYPLDGEFTGQFNLTIPAGEWRPVYSISTPMFTRQQINEDITLHPNPIKVDVELGGGGEGYHKLLVDAEREFVDMNTLLVDGKVRFPNGDILNFSLTEQNPDIREYLIVDYEYGIFRIKLTAYGNTVDGRDFILDVPEFSFSSLAPEPEPSEEDLMQAEMTDGADGEMVDLEAQIGEQMLAEAEKEAEPEPMSPTLFWGLIIGVNLLILLVGGLVIWLLMRDKPPKAEKPASKTKTEDEGGKADKPSFISKLTGIFKKKNKEADDKNDGAIDLSA